MSAVKVGVDVFAPVRVAVSLVHAQALISRRGSTVEALPSNVTTAPGTTSSWSGPAFATGSLKLETTVIVTVDADEYDIGTVSHNQ